MTAWLTTAGFFILGSVLYLASSRGYENGNIKDQGNT
jgi:hypothetical protein